MPVLRINEFPEGSGSLSNDDILLFMDDPSGSGITKKISLSEISSAIGGGGGGNPFDQDLNTTNFPSFSGVSLSNGTTLAQGTFDNSTGGNNGISLNCYVGYELNWQGGHLKSTQDGGLTAAHIWCDSSIEFPGSNVDNMEINSSGLIFPDGSVQTTAPNDKCYGSFYDTTTQTNPSVSGVNTMVFNTVDLSHNISMVDNAKLTFHRTSTYNIQFSAQLDKTDGGDDEVDIWISKNNTDVEWTNTRISMHQQDAKTVAAWNFMVSANSGDYIEFKWYSADPNMRILAQSGLINPTRPNIPSIILTANEI